MEEDVCKTMGMSSFELLCARTSLIVLTPGRQRLFGFCQFKKGVFFYA
jgi:hypothetical protein